MWIAILQKILAPVLAEVIVKLIERYASDAAFRAKLDQAAQAARNAQSKEDLFHAAADIQKTLSPGR